MYKNKESPKKQLPSILLKNVELVFTNLITNLNTLQIYKKKTPNSDIPFFMSKLYKKLTNTLTVNLIKSSWYFIFLTTLRFLQPKLHLPGDKPTVYTKVVKLVTLPFHHSQLNTLVLYILSTITLNYFSSTNWFRIIRNNLPYSSEKFNFLLFVNQFYFKIKHY